MADRLSLSCWVKGFQTLTMPKHWENFLKLFPFSRLTKAPVVCRVRAVGFAEPALFEDAYQQPFRPEGFAQLSREYQHEDVAYEVECDWDLMRKDGDWRLGPVRVGLYCFGPAYDNEVGDHLRIDFGVEDLFLPEPGDEASLRASQANLRSLLHLVSELSSKLQLEQKHLWSESGTNIAAKLQEAAKLGFLMQ
ncbi:MAG: hypothetical protein HY820_34405 [Acidobacteria bacterium]|nr:hypothetical protein [Acidobacteriota bacterium]